MPPFRHAGAGAELGVKTLRLRARVREEIVVAICRPAVDEADLLAWLGKADIRRADPPQRFAQARELVAGENRASIAAAVLHQRGAARHGPEEFRNQFLHRCAVLLSLMQAPGRLRQAARCDQAASPLYELGEPSQGRRVNARQVGQDDNRKIAVAHAQAPVAHFHLRQREGIHAVKRVAVRDDGFHHVRLVVQRVLQTELRRRAVRRHAVAHRPVEQQLFGWSLGHRILSRQIQSDVSNGLALLQDIARAIHVVGEMREVRPKRRSVVHCRPEVRNPAGRAQRLRRIGVGESIQRVDAAQEVQVGAELEIFECVRETIRKVGPRPCLGQHDGFSGQVRAGTRPARRAELLPFVVFAHRDVDPAIACQRHRRRTVGFHLRGDAAFVRPLSERLHELHLGELRESAPEIAANVPRIGMARLEQGLEVRSDIVSAARGEGLGHLGGPSRSIDFEAVAEDRADAAGRHGGDQLVADGFQIPIERGPVVVIEDEAFGAQCGPLHLHARRRRGEQQHFAGARRRNRRDGMFARLQRRLGARGNAPHANRLRAVLERHRGSAIGPAGAGHDVDGQAQAPRRIGDGAQHLQELGRQILEIADAARRIVYRDWIGGKHQHAPDVLRRHPGHLAFALRGFPRRSENIPVQAHPVRVWHVAKFRGSAARRRGRVRRASAGPGSQRHRRKCKLAARHFLADSRHDTHFSKLNRRSIRPAVRLHA